MKHNTIFANRQRSEKLLIQLIFQIWFEILFKKIFIFLINNYEESLSKIEFKTDNEAKIRKEIKLITTNEREKLNNIRSRSGWLSHWFGYYFLISSLFHSH